MHWNGLFIDFDEIWVYYVSIDVYEIDVIWVYYVSIVLIDYTMWSIVLTLGIVLESRFTDTIWKFNFNIF